MIQGILFDVDGTLVDSVDLQARAWNDAFQRFGRVVARLKKSGARLVKEQTSFCLSSSPRKNCRSLELSWKSIELNFSNKPICFE